MESEKQSILHRRLHSAIQRSASGFRAGLSQMSGVSTMPGEMQLTLTPLSAHSQPSDCVSLTTADLDALYAAWQATSGRLHATRRRVVADWRAADACGV